MAYVLSPKLCHAFVGYLEEEAVKTYTHVISDLDKGRLPEWETKKVRHADWPLTFQSLPPPLLTDLVYCARGQICAQYHTDLRVVSHSS